MPVTRVEIVEHIGAAFASAPIGRGELLTLARQGGARPAVLKVLEELPDGPFRKVRDLWPALPDIPIEPDVTAP